MDQGEDEKLAARILNGNRKAQEELYLKYIPRIRREVYCCLRGGPDVEDVAGDIWGAVIGSLEAGQFTKGSSLGSYIFGITRNKIADYFRKKRIPMEEIPETYPDTALTAEEKLEREETVSSLRKGIRKLDLKYKRVLSLYYYKGLPIAEIGRRLNLPSTKVSQQKSYALKKLREILGEENCKVGLQVIVLVSCWKM